MNTIAWASALTLITTSAIAAQTPATRPHFNVVEAGIPELQAALASGRVTSRELVLGYLARIAMHDRTLHAVMAVSPTALAEADAFDRERAQGRLRGPLHG